MAIGVLILGESGTGKTYSIHNFKPEEVKILSVAKPILPFRGKYDIVKTPDGESIIRELKKTTKKNIVIDDFQYILGVPMMKRVGEKGWDKFNEIQQPYADVLDTLSELPDDVIVFINSHVKYNDDTGRVQIKTIGKALDNYLTVEGLFMIVLGTSVVDGKYYFMTQNNGSNTLKSPEGMFPSVAIPNDLKYVEEKIRNYYYMEGAKTDEEIAAEDAANTVADEDLKKKRGRKSRKDSVAEVDTGTGTIVGATPEEQAEEEQEEKKTRSRKKRTVEPEGSAADVLTEDSYFFIPYENNVVMKHAGDVAPEGGEPITKKQFGAAVSSIAKQGVEVDVAGVIKAAEETEEVPEEVPFEDIDKYPDLQVKPEDVGLKPRASRRRRKA